VEVNASLLPINKEHINGEMMKNIIATNLNKSFLLISIQPDTFYYNFDKAFTKKVPVKLNAQLSFEQQFGLSEKTEINPKTVAVSGPKKVIDTISYLETDELKLSNIKENTSGKISISTKGLNYLKIEPNKVEYHIHVEKYTEKTVEVPISIINPQVKNNIVIFPKKIKVSCMVSLSEYERVTEDMFEAVADFSKINIAEDKHVFIELRRKPAFVKNTNYTPKKAEFIINK
jgi:YbbR domain-containing protein